MTSADAFIDKWCNDIQGVLERRLNALRYDLLESDDETSRTKARKDIAEISRWLDLPTKAARGRGRPRTRGKDAIHALTLYLRTNKSWRRIAFEVCGCTHVCPQCRRRKGKPLEGGLKKGPRCSKCDMLIRTKPEVEQSCHPCGEAIRDAVEHLIKFLTKQGVYIPPLKDLLKLSPEEREKVLFPKQH